MSIAEPAATKRLPTIDDFVRGCESGHLVTGGEAAKILEEHSAKKKPASKSKSDGVALTDASELDPATEAEAFLLCHQSDGRPHAVFYRGSFHAWRLGRYVEVTSTEVQGELVKFLNRRFRKLTASILNNVMVQLRAQSQLSSEIEQPAWLDEPPMPWKTNEVLATKGQLVHLPSLTTGKPFAIPSTPRFFSTSALDYEFDASAPKPQQWLDFLGQLWPNDPESISTLQEWFGYCLRNDTSLQKLMVLLGPTRGGKGVCTRVLTALVGSNNVAGPTLASFESNFGLSSLLGKSVGIISDARLGGRADQNKIVERLLSITGEDPLDVDRKYRDVVMAKIPARLTIVSNELPRLAESSGALSARIIILRLTESWLGKEDPGLTTKLLEELPGILHWAIAGSCRLQKRGYFIQPKSGNELLAEMADLSSPVGAFVRDQCVTGTEHQAAIDDVYRAWCEWCKANGREHPGTRHTFGRDLRAAVSGLKTSNRREGAHRVRYYEGIGLSNG